MVVTIYRCVLGYDVRLLRYLGIDLVNTRNSNVNK